MEIIGLLDFILVSINLHELFTEQVCDSSCQHEVGNEVVLIVHWCMTESEPGGAYAAGLVEGHICDKLLSADTILLAAVALYFDVDELAHL